MGRTAKPNFALPVKRSLLKLGHDIRDARRRRRVPMALMAERVGVSRSTLLKAEKGNPSVSIGVYATILFVLGLNARVADLADPTQDLVGQSLDEERLPQRIRLKK